MSSSPRSDSAATRRANTRAHSRLRRPLTALSIPTLILGAVIGALSAGGCQDDIVTPSHGTVTVSLRGASAGAFEGGQLYRNGELVVENLREATYRDTLPPGVWSFRYEKECAVTSPADELTIDLAAGDDARIDWLVAVSGGIEVTSTMAGARIFLDGVDTGLTTPATLECVEAGSREISVDLLGAAPVEPKTVEVADGLLQVDFALEPLDQGRGAFVEILTATECPNCLPVDEAAEDLWGDAERVAQGAVTVQMHHPWAGESDPFFTQETFDRNAFYGAAGGSAGHPIRYTNGVLRVQGAGNGDIPTILDQIRGEVDPFLGGQQGGAGFALYWLGTEHRAGEGVTARMRVVALADVPNPATTEVLGMVYKHNLVTFVRIHRQNETFYRVVREIESAGSCQALGLLERGDWADVEFTFDLSWDTEWSEDGMGVVGLVQNLDAASKAVYNVRHTFVE